MKSMSVFVETGKDKYQAKPLALDEHKINLWEGNCVLGHVRLRGCARHGPATDTRACSCALQNNIVNRAAQFPV